jgi:predicted transposase/invertase (TIGR01784 family)
LYYLARMLSQQLAQGEDYSQLRSAVGIHLLDFDLFSVTPEQRQQAHWRFEMRDQHQPAVGLGNLLQLNLIELKKADRLQQAQDARADWITFFEHWQEETTMAAIEHPPIREAMSQIRQLSADEHARRLAFVRERALHDEATLLKEARQEGLEQGLEQGRQQGLEEGVEQGIDQGRRETARGLLEQTTLDDATIATTTQLPLAEIAALRQGLRR